jgi:glycosyltransferase involved in cell wall biosynthesis
MKSYIIATSPKGRAIANYFFAMAAQLARQGDKVVLVLDQHYDGPDMDQGIPVYVWPSKRPTRRRDFLFFYALCKDHKPDVVLGQFGSANVVLLVGRLLNIRNRLVYMHTMSGQLRLDSNKPAWRNRLDHKSKELILKLCPTAILTNSEATRQDLQKQYHLGEQKISVLHYLIPDVLAKGKIKKAADRELAISFVARLDTSKGQVHIIHEMPEIIQDYPDIKVYFVGKGRQLTTLEQLSSKLGLEDHVVFTGAVSLEEVYQFMAGTLVHVSASAEEAFGLVNAEALSMGTPVLANKVGGIKDIVEDGRNGYFFDPEKPGDLKKKLRLIIDGDWQKFSENARKSFLDKFSCTEENLKVQLARLEQRLR